MILTYNRTEFLLGTLASFKGLPNVNKIVVVSNNPDVKIDDLLPDIGIPIYVSMCLYEMYLSKIYIKIRKVAWLAENDTAKPAKML